MKIGILTHYYGNNNYGGLLQAYALVTVLEKYQQYNIQVEQIMFDMYSKTTDITTKLKKSKIKELIKRIIKKNSGSPSFKVFEEKISHSVDVYTQDTISNCVSLYDVFVVGSDQVWNMNWYKQEFFLTFVPPDKHKVSYAASMPNINLSSAQVEIITKHIQGFDAISVRESETAYYLQQFTSKKVQCCLDPTLLLKQSDWDKIISDRIVKEKYIFCYFLGNEPGFRKVATAFAKEKKIKIVTLPHLLSLCKADFQFGNKKMYNISPEEFLSLIKNAEYVITDSFHAAVFSNLYQKKYYVFNRTSAGEMSTRITNLLTLFGQENRFCFGSKLDVDYMCALEKGEPTWVESRLDVQRQNSLEFIDTFLKNCTEDGAK